MSDRIHVGVNIVNQVFLLQHSRAFLTSAPKMTLCCSKKLFLAVYLPLHAHGCFCSIHDDFMYTSLMHIIEEGGAISTCARCICTAASEQVWNNQETFHFKS